MQQGWSPFGTVDVEPLAGASAADQARQHHNLGVSDADTSLGSIIENLIFAGKVDDASCQALGDSAEKSECNFGGAARRLGSAARLNEDAGGCHHCGVICI